MKTTNPKNYIELLEVYRLGLTFGLIDKNEIIKWADKIIEHDELPDNIILDISLSGHQKISDIVAMIYNYIGEVNSILPIRVIMGILYLELKIGRIPIDKVIEILNWITYNTVLSENEKYLLYGLDDYHELAINDKYGDIDEIEKEVSDILDLYKNFRLDNFEEWTKINEVVEINIPFSPESIERDSRKILSFNSILNRIKNWKFW
ncbi:MAG: hypothetical protein IPM56_05315 [Ignavibacteriales bacterium]|nr:MAG: hypothetical protein IPM56_05315 [Ignavibacteriales bacterium]